jgi:hypothetical protein
MRRAAWPWWIVAGGALFAVVLSVDMAAQLPLGRLTLALALLWSAVGGAGAAAFVLAGTAIGRVRRRPGAIAPGGRAERVPRVLARWVSASLGGVWLTLATFNVEVLTQDLALPTVVFAAFAGLAWGLPAWTSRVPMLLLAVTFLIVEVPRELGTFSVSWTRSSMDTNRDDHRNTTCNTNNWPDENSVRAATRSWRIVGDLGGNVGSLVDKGNDSQERAGGELLVIVHGDVDIGWARCGVPFYKNVSTHADLTLSYAVSDANGGTIDCTGDGTLALDIDYAAWGSESCRDVRKAVAQELVKQLEAEARAIAATK